MKSDRLKIMLTGFYGAGNSGDEAMLRNFVYHIRRRVPNSLIYVATDKIGLWKYDEVYYISSMDRSRLYECDLLVVGGGDLGVGFGWHLLPLTKKNSVKCVNLGVSFSNTWTAEETRPVVREIMKLYDLVFVRDKGSKDNLDMVGVDGEATTDIAIDLPGEVHRFAGKKNNNVCIVVRETSEIHKNQMVDLANNVIKFLGEDYFITLLPFSPEDMVFCKHLDGLVVGRSEMVNTLNPEHHKYIISHSKFLVSLGRYHALVYGMEAAIPMIGVTYPEVYLYSKIDAWMHHMGIHDCCMNFIDPFDNFRIKWKRLVDKQDTYRHKIGVRYEEMRQVNNEQFDRIVRLVK